MLDPNIQYKYDKLIKSNPDFKKVVTSLNNDFELSMRKIAHELGNVLTLVNSSLQIIESSHPEVHDFKYWNSTTDDVRYLINLVSELSVYNNSNKLNLAPTDLSNIVKNVVSSFNSHYSDNNSLTRNICLQADVDEYVPNIIGDETKLRQVIINLTKNALEAFSSETLQSNRLQKEQPIVSLSLKYVNDKIILKVSDNGCGMDQETISTIFTPMVSYKENGTGLGLSISQKIIHSHNGTLIVNSIPNKGTVFTITLPV